MIAISNFAVTFTAVLIICKVSQVELTPIVGGEIKMENSDQNQNLTNGNSTVNVKNVSDPNTLLQNETDHVDNDTLVVDNTGGTTESNEIEIVEKTEGDKIEEIVKNGDASDFVKSNTNSSSSLDEIGAMQVLVSSKPLMVVETNFSTSVSSDGNVTVVSLPINVGINESTGEFDYKKKARPSYYPYMEQILRSEDIQDSQNDTTLYPTIVKSEKFASYQNSLSSSNGHENLPNFSEHEMNKRRLNHWKLHHLMKGVNMEGEQGKKLGQYGTKNGFPIVFGQKRDALPPDSVSTGQLENVQNVTSNGEGVDGGESKLRTFFSWFSNPLKGKLVADGNDSLLQQAKAQQAVLPFALSYRGDFLFW